MRDLESSAAVAVGAPEAPIGRDELTQGLMLMRASTMKVVRLQLAMERRDRRVALEAVDDLVTLDRQLQHFLGTMAAAGDTLHAMESELEEQRGALAREKLTLAAGMSGAKLAARSPAWDDPAPPAEPEPAEQAAVSSAHAPEQVGEPVHSGATSYEFDTRGPARLVAAAALLLIFCAGGAALAVGMPGLEDGIARITSLLGG